MPDYDNNMTGVLFRHDKKGNDKAPDYKGSAEVEGIEYQLSAWINSKKSDGEKYMKLKFELPQGAAPAAQQSAASSGAGDFDRSPTRAADEDDDIPFAWEGFQMFPHDAGRTTNRYS